LNLRGPAFSDRAKFFWRKNREFAKSGKAGPSKILLVKASLLPDW